MSAFDLVADETVMRVVIPLHVTDTLDVPTVETLSVRRTPSRLYTANRFFT
jgi:hypothetical protein